MLLIPLRTIPTVNATSIVCLTEQKIIKIVTMLLLKWALTERERDSFVCHIILQFYCENLHAKLTLSTHTAYLHKNHLKITVNRFTQMTTTTSTELCTCSAHNLMVNFRFSALRLWVYSHWDFMSQLLTVNTHILPGYVRYRYSFILRPIVIMVRMEFLPMRKMKTLFHAYVFISIFTFNISLLIEWNAVVSGLAHSGANVAVWYRQTYINRWLLRSTMELFICLIFLFALTHTADQYNLKLHLRWSSRFAWHKLLLFSLLGLYYIVNLKVVN